MNPDNTGEGAAKTAPPSERRTASERVLRMLSIVPWIAVRDGPQVDEVCSRFGINRRRLLDDLSVLQFVGLPPYTPDTLMEVVIEGGRVWVRLADVFSRPLRLTPNQALALVAAGAALIDAGPAGQAASTGTTSPASGPLATGLAKLAGALGIQPNEALGVRLGRSRPDVFHTLNEAIATQHRVSLDYFSYGRDSRTTRQVDPYRVFAKSGAWYLHGHCHSAGAPRLFRVDRIYAAEMLGASFERPADADRTPKLFDADPDAPRVTLELTESARWVIETYPVEATTELEDRGVRAQLAVSSVTWLERLLLRLGPEARLIHATDPRMLRARPAAAGRVLARYGD
jgi:proteasome accessory factor C